MLTFLLPATNIGRYDTDNIYKIICQHLPEQALQPWKFSKSPAGWWDHVVDLWNQNDPVGLCIAVGYLEYLADKFTSAKRTKEAQQTQDKPTADRAILSPAFNGSIASFPLDTWYHIMPQVNYV